VTTRARHLQDDCLLDTYFAERAGDAIEPPVAEHLSDCDECGARYTEMTEFLDLLRRDADAEGDAIFTPDYLRAQHAQVLQRLEHVGRQARVLDFPGRSTIGRTSPSAPRHVRRWIAATVAAGVFAGVGTGIFFQSNASRGAGAPSSTPTFLTPDLTNGLAVSASETPDDPFLSELELATQQPRTLELQAIDALTPHVREISYESR
jgi:hypothetical protein